MEFVILALIAVIVWYAGASINAVLQGAGAMASKEFEVYEIDQDIRLAKTRKVQSQKAQKLVEDGPVMTTKEIKELLGAINGVNNGKA